MTNIDQFESLFKKADKPRFHLEELKLSSFLVVSDGDQVLTDQFSARAGGFLGEVVANRDVKWHKIEGRQYTSVSDLLRQVDAIEPDLICTYRNLHAPLSDYPYSLGAYLDVMSQVTPIPVLVLPSPLHDGAIPTSTNAVMAVTDHLTGDDHLVSYAARLTARHGKLLLTHVEDELTFERYAEVISKIPSIETDSARQAIREQLLDEPHDYVKSCSAVLAEQGLPIQLEEVVTLGHSLRDYKRLIDEHRVDLVVLNTKQEDQMAMHGLAYPLCVELRETPLLML